MGAVGVAMGVASAIQIYGQVKTGVSQAKAANASAELKNMQADELLARQAINEEVMRNAYERTSREVGAVQLSRGFDVSGAGATAEMLLDFRSNLTNSRREADFKARMLRAGAEIDQNLASDVRTGTIIAGFSTAVSTGATLYNYNRGPGPSKGLPG